MYSGAPSMAPPLCWCIYQTPTLCRHTGYQIITWGSRLCEGQWSTKKTLPFIDFFRVWYLINHSIFWKLTRRFVEASVRKYWMSFDWSLKFWIYWMFFWLMCVGQSVFGASPSESHWYTKKKVISGLASFFVMEDTIYGIYPVATHSTENEQKSQACIHHSVYICPS